MSAIRLFFCFLLLQAIVGVTKRSVSELMKTASKFLPVGIVLKVSRWFLMIIIQREKQLLLLKQLVLVG